MILIVIGIFCIVQGLILLIAYTPFYYRWFKGDPMLPLITRKENPENNKTRFVVSKIVGLVCCIMGIGIIMSAV